MQRAHRTPIAGNPGRWLDAAAYSGAIASCVAGTLTIAVSHALEIPTRMSVVCLAICGTAVVYNVDRLRDLERDRTTAPLRSEFIERHQPILRLFVTLSALASAGFAWKLGPATWLLCGGVLLVGLMHRRLKLIRSIKSLYVSLAWCAIVVGLPVLAAPARGDPLFAPFDSPEPVIWTLLILGSAFLANLITSNLDPASSETIDSPGTRSSARVLAPALASCLIGIVFAFLAPEQIRALGLVPAAELAAVSNFRSGERYGLVAVDGALAVGALAALALWGC